MNDLVSEFKDLNKQHLEEIEEVAFEIINSDLYQKTRKYMQHGDVSVFEHSVMVACRCLYYADKAKNEVDRKLLIKAALLHDYFGYDWHIDKDKSGGKKHAWRHPGIAANNAMKDFGLTKKEENAIRSHMWPLGKDSLPKTKEAWILLIADKDSAFKETFKDGKFKW